MNRLPTDRQILLKIYKQYFKTFEQFSKEKADRDTKIYVPIDIKQISKEFGLDPDIVFGRLYYHLDKKYGYEQSDGTKVCLFSPVVGKDRNAVNFPLVSAILSDMQEEKKKYMISIILSIIALTVSFLSILTSIIK